MKGYNRMIIPLNKNTMGREERKALIQTFDSGYMTMGKKTKEFECPLHS